MKYVEEYIEYDINEIEKNKFSTDTKAGLNRTASAIVDKHINRFKEVNVNLNKVLQFLDKNKTRDFEKRPMEVKYSDYTFKDNSTKHDLIYTITSNKGYILFQKKINNIITNNEKVIKFLPTYIRRVKRTGTLVAFNIFLQNIPGIDKEYISHFLKGAN